MCKGLGRRQRAILDALAEMRPGRAIDLHDLMPEDYTDGEYRSTLRAARKLADAGNVALVSGSWGAAVRLKAAEHRQEPPAEDAGAVPEWYCRVYGGARRP